MKNKKTLSIEDFTPINKSLIISICKYLKEIGGKVSLREVKEMFHLTNSKTEKLINEGIQLGIISFEIEGGYFYRGQYCVINYVSITDTGEKLLEDNQS